MGSFFYFEGV